MVKKLYCGGAFDFDYMQNNYKKAALEDYRVTSVLKNLDVFLYGRKNIALSQNLEYIGPFYCETDTMIGNDIVTAELKMIEKCTDCIFVLDRASCPGTIAECIYAATLKKNLHIFYLQKNTSEETESDLHTPCWFPILSAVNINPDNTHIFSFNLKDELHLKIKSLIEKLSKE